MIYCGQLLRADNFSQILERKTKQEYDSISLHRKLMTRIWTWKQILDSLSFGNCCFCASFYTVRQFEKKRKIENLVDCPKKRKPVRASREKVLTEKIFLTDFLRFWAEFWGWKCAKRKQKVHFLTNSLVLKNCWNSDCLKISAGIWVEQKIRQKLTEKIKKNKKEKRIFVKLRQFSKA